MEPTGTQPVSKFWTHVSFSVISNESCYCCWILILGLGLNSGCVVPEGPSLDGSLPQSSLSAPPGAGGAG